tara:strand:+ start:2617 stop:3054 length:438 start_codon:yes stop_codon:yes gene_type:complete
MRIVIQRVNSASVFINNNKYSFIQDGLLCLVGFCNDDNESDFIWSINKIINLKIFKQNQSVQDVGGQLLIVSQFTLFASIKKGSKPSWIRAAKLDIAKKMYDNFLNICFQKFPNKIQAGIFGADMQIHSVNDGPVTICIDTKNKE